MTDDSPQIITNCLSFVAYGQTATVGEKLNRYGDCFYYTYGRSDSRVPLADGARPTGIRFHFGARPVGSRITVPAAARASRTAVLSATRRTTTGSTRRRRRAAVIRDRSR